MGVARVVEIHHPNREKASSKATKAVVVVLLIVSVVLMLLMIVGGWSVLQGAKPVTVAYVIAYLIIAVLVARWSRGALPVAAALAIVLAIFAAIAVPGWLDRNAAGFHQPPIDADILAFVCALLVPVQLLLVAFAMRGFTQAWNVEVERQWLSPAPRRRAPQPT